MGVLISHKMRDIAWAGELPKRDKSDKKDEEAEKDPSASPHTTQEPSQTHGSLDSRHSQKSATDP